MLEDTRPMRAQRRFRLLGKTRPMRAQRLDPEVAAPEGAAAEPQEKPFTWQRVLRIFLFLLAFFALLVVGIGAGAYYGVYQGERAREQRRIDEAQNHYQIGVEHLDAGKYELAIAEFEYVLKLNAGHPYAQQGIAEAESRIAARPTPTPVTTPTEVYRIVADELYQKAVAHYKAQEWQEAAAALTQVRALDPTYQADLVEEMLFQSLYNAGMVLLEEYRFEEGIFFLDQAVALRPLDEEALAQRSLAVRYMTALGYWGVDWDRCIERFGQLYAIAPNYKDVFQRLYRAHVAYGDAWYAQEEMCPAEEQYVQALQLANDAEVEQRRAEAAEICLVATPTPIPPIEGTQAITLTELPPGFNTGRLAYPVYNTQSGIYDVYVLSTDKTVTRVAVGADQPCWIWGRWALGYRNLLSPGLSLLVSGEGAPRQISPDTGLGWPTFSPGGDRIAYAVRDMAGEWQIYIAPLDNSSGPKAHAQGFGPIWAPNGWLAWTGCDDTGTCGIFIDNVDDGQSPARLSASINDIALNWSPDGGSLAYMSNHTGNWEIYLVNTSGGFVQITDDLASDGLPAWSPDGVHLAFVSNRDGSWGLYIVNRNGEDPHKILTLGPNMPDWTAQRLSWSP